MKQDGLRAKDGLTQSTDRKLQSRSVRFTMSTRDLAMGLARLDPHKIAPAVLGGVYTIVQVLDNDTEESRAAMMTTLELAGIVALWTSIEKRQISKNSHPGLKALYQKLSELIVKLYEGIIVLFGTMMAYFDKNRFRKWFKDARLGLMLTWIIGQILGAIAPAHLEWKNMQAEIKSRETNCNNIKNKITIEKENQEKASRILKWVSSYDIRASFQNVLDRTGIEMKYSARCQWILDHREFEEWLIQGNNSVLWLKGTIGTGKTTLMARAMQKMQNSAMTQIHGMPLAIFFFQKATDSSKTLLSVEICLRSLVRQLSWNNTDEEIEPLVEGKYNDLCNQLNEDSLLSTKECKELLKKLISERETYIMIDAVDECESPDELLSELAGLIPQKGHRALHIMLCGRDDKPISDYFENCPTIATNSADTLEDQKFYIDHEIDDICQTRKRALFASTSKDFPSRLKNILKEKGGGLFRWIEIQLDIFRVKYFRTFSEIEEQLTWLGTHTKHDMLDKEYARLFGLLKDHPPNDKLALKTLPNDKLALKMLKLIACSMYDLSAEDLAEAMTASKYVNDDMELTPDDVRRILVGFISETKQSDYERRLAIRSNVPTVQLAHSSVLEYLTDDVGGFSSLEQHSEAALLCFSRISALEKQPELPANVELSTSDGTSTEEVPYFLIYSCKAWPRHCRRAFDKDPRCLLVEQAKEFILSHGYMKWNETIRSREFNRKRGGSYDRYFMPGKWSCSDLSARPGFVIADFNLIELLEFPEIRTLIDPQHINDLGITLLLHALLFSDLSTVARLIELNLNQVRPSKGQYTLEVAADRGFDDVVEKLLNNSDVNVRSLRGNIALYALTGRLSFGIRLKNREEEVPAVLKAIRILLQGGANIFHIDESGDSLMHYVAYSRISVLFRLYVDHAKQLEESGLIGSVQRLLRVRDLRGETPIDSASQPHAEYLQDTLDEAVARNGGKIMYDFDTPEIAKISEGHVEKELLIRYLKNRASFLPNSRHVDLNIDSYKEAARQYITWLKHRNRELEEQYEANRQQITSGRNVIESS